MDEMIREAERFLEVKDGLKTAIIGKPNVGKSSLLNALSAKEKAIVTDVAERPGTRSRKMSILVRSPCI